MTEAITKEYLNITLTERLKEYPTRAELTSILDERFERFRINIIQEIKQDNATALAEIKAENAISLAQTKAENTKNLAQTKADNAALLEEVREEGRRTIGALKEDWDGKMKSLREGDKTYTDMSKRYEKENETDHQQFNRRLLKLELKKAKK